MKTRIRLFFTLLLVSASATAQTIVIETERTRILELVDGVLAEHREAAKARSVLLSFDVPQAVPEQVVCDPLRVAQALGLVVEHSIQSSRESEVRVRLDVESTARWSTSLLRLSVEDRGAEVPSEIGAQLFEPFFFGRSQTQPDGIGLALSRQLARAMNGDVVFHSGPSPPLTLVLPCAAESWPVVTRTWTLFGPLVITI